MEGYAYVLLICFRAANAAKSEDIRGDDVNKELLRQYHCYAYNTLIAVISTTQTELKFYQAFLFNENLKKVVFSFCLACCCSLQTLKIIVVLLLFTLAVGFRVKFCWIT